MPLPEVKPLLKVCVSNLKAELLTRTMPQTSSASLALSSKQEAAKADQAKCSLRHEAAGFLSIEGLSHLLEQVLENL